MIYSTVIDTEIFTPLLVASKLFSSAVHKKVSIMRSLCVDFLKKKSRTHSFLFPEVLVEFAGGIEKVGYSGKFYLSEGFDAKVFSFLLGEVYCKKSTSEICKINHCI